MDQSIITLIAVAGIVGLIFWISDQMGLPKGVSMVVKGTAGLIAIVYLLQKLISIT